MKLSTPIIIDLLEFFKYAKFDYIELGQTKEWILNNFPDPDGFNAEFLSYNNSIWRYGNIEFHFDKSNKLSLIYSDHLNELHGGENLKLNKWILEDYKKLNLIFLLTELNRQEINYCKKSDKYGIKLRLERGVELHFINDDKKIGQVDSNQFLVNAFSLSE